jgi:mannose-6-phosphate isomerase class I
VRRSNYQKFPVVLVSPAADACAVGWDAIGARLRTAIDRLALPVTTVAVECYPGVLHDEVLPALQRQLQPALVIRMDEALLAPERIDALVRDDVTDDPVFGYLSRRRLEEFFDSDKLAAIRSRIDAASDGVVLLYGTGASLLGNDDLLVYADLARWEAQTRFRRDEISNLGVENRALKWSLQYKRAFFVDWRVADRQKKQVLSAISFLLDTNVPGEPKMLPGEVFRDALRQTARRPFRVVPFFDPAPWGGQWMKEVCGLDRAAAKYGWCFDCVPEENSLLLGFGDVHVEVPSIDLVFYQPRELLGDGVHARFGAEFPIRFDFLDTVGGGNLSLQVHPLTEYMQDKFGMHYTQDESYYLLDAAGDDAYVYLGLRDGIRPSEMAIDLDRAQRSATDPFPAERYVNKWPAKRHDHFHIPAGTVHCSGANSMVLEISATPYIFTFKMWDWGRLGLDGVPRPIHLAHALANVQWDRTTQWTRDNLVNRVEPIAEGDGWREERTGLHEREFIETRRHWFDKRVPHKSTGGVNVLNLVEGEEAIVESPTGAFPPLVVHYAETFIVPAAAGDYTITPHDPGVGQTCATVKAYVRT